MVLNNFFEKYGNTLNNALVAMHFIFILALPKAYEYMPFALFIVSIIYFICHPNINSLFNSTSAKRTFIYIVIAMSLFLASYLLSIIIFQGKLKELDSGSRFLFFSLILLFSIRFPINPKLFFHSIAIGNLVTFMVALFQKFYLGWGIAFTYYSNKIQFGDIAGTLALFSIITSLHFLQQKKYSYAILHILASCCGLCACFLSEVRGAWIGLPLLIIYIFYSFRYLSKKNILGIIAILTIIVALGISQFNVTNRISLVLNEVKQHQVDSNIATSNGLRLEMWKNSWYSFKQKPIFGWGKSGIQQATEQNIEQQLVIEHEILFGHAHNQFLDELSIRGIIGFSAFILFLLMPLKLFWTQIKKTLYVNNNIKYTVCVMGVIHIVNIIFFNLTQAYFFHNSGVYFYAFPLMILLSFLFTQEDNISDRT